MNICFIENNKMISENNKHVFYVVFLNISTIFFNMLKLYYDVRKFWKSSNFSLSLPLVSARVCIYPVTTHFHIIGSNKGSNRSSGCNLPYSINKLSVQCPNPWQFYNALHKIHIRIVQLLISRNQRFKQVESLIFYGRDTKSVLASTRPYRYLHVQNNAFSKFYLSSNPGRNWQSFNIVMNIIENFRSTSPPKLQ